MTLYRDFRGADPDKRAMLVACGLMEELPEEPADSLAVPVVTLEPNESLNTNLTDEKDCYDIFNRFGSRMRGPYDARCPAA